MKKHPLFFSSCVIALGCSAQALPPPPPPPAPAVPAPAVTPVASSTPPAVVEPAPKSPFFVLGQLPGEMTLVDAGERGFLYSTRGVELQLVGDEVVQDPLLKRGLPGIDVMHEVSSVGGRWPDAAWLSTVQPWGRTGFTSLWTWDGKLWRKKDSSQPGRFIEAVQPWVGGRLLALEQAGMMFDASFRILSGDQKVPLPKFTKAPPSNENVFCQTEMRVERFATLPNGEVFVAGQRCDAKTQAVEIGVEHWAPGATKSTIEYLPDAKNPTHTDQSGFSVTGLAVLSPTSAFLSAANVDWQGGREHQRVVPYFAHFDGQRWQALPPPIAGGVTTLWSQGQTLYGLDHDDQLWSASATPGATWSRVPLPAELKAQASDKTQVTGFWPRPGGDLWAIVNVTRGKETLDTYLLHTHPAKAPLPTLEAFERKEAELRLPGPPVDYCPTPFVLLYTLGRKAPADYDYPSTRAALKGHAELASGVTFVEFAREGRRYFGARVPDFDVGKKLASLVKTKVTGSTPELVCHDPVVARTLAIDLATGELTK